MIRAIITLIFLFLALDAQAFTSCVDDPHCRAASAKPPIYFAVAAFSSTPHVLNSQQEAANWVFEAIKQEQTMTRPDCTFELKDVTGWTATDEMKIADYVEKGVVNVQETCPYTNSESGFESFITNGTIYRGLNYYCDNGQTPEQIGGVLSDVWKCKIAACQIMMPSVKSVWSLNGDNHRSTTISFKGIDQNFRGMIKWNVKLGYKPKNGAQETAIEDTFYSAINGMVNHTFVSEGGELTISGTEQPEDVLGNPDKRLETPCFPMNAYIDGDTITEAEIISEIVSQTATAASNASVQMATPRLLVGLANSISGLRQFSSDPTLIQYGISGLWPYQTKDGQHVGIFGAMPSMASAFDWQYSVSRGVLRYFQAFNTAKTVVNFLRSKNPTLPMPTSLQMENMALYLYGDSASFDYNHQFYAPALVSGKMAWQDNPKAVPDAAAFVKKVRSLIK